MWHKKPYITKLFTPQGRELRVQAKEVAVGEGDDEVCWGTCVTDKLQDVDAAGREMSEQETLEALRVIREAKAEVPKSTPKTKQASTWTWRKKTLGGHRFKFVLDSGAVKTIVPKDAIPGMKLGKSKGGSFRVASGEVLLNLGPT